MLTSKTYSYINITSIWKPNEIPSKDIFVDCIVKTDLLSTTYYAFSQEPIRSGRNTSPNLNEKSLNGTPCALHPGGGWGASNDFKNFTPTATY